jgi:hypothetical protein
MLVVILATAVCGCASLISPTANNKLKKGLLIKDSSRNKFPNLLTILNKDQIPKGNKYLSIIRKQPTTIWVHVARLTNNPTKLLKRYNKIAISVSQSKKFVVVVTDVKKHTSDGISWSGSLENGKGQSNFVLGPNGITGTLHADSLFYKFEPIGDGLQAIFKIDRSNFGAD